MHRACKVGCSVSYEHAACPCGLRQTQQTAVSQADCGVKAQQSDSDATRERPGSLCSRYVPAAVSASKTRSACTLIICDQTAACRAGKQRHGVRLPQQAAVHAAAVPVAERTARSIDADTLAACVEACRQPVLLHALAQLRRQSICPVHHAGAHVVTVRASRFRTLLPLLLAWRSYQAQGI